LVKAAAVQHHAVEVVEPNVDGKLVRRTYVGTLLDPLNKLAICSGWPFNESAVQAIRLGPSGPSGERRVLVYKKNDYIHARRKVHPIACRPQGQLRINALLKGEKTFPLSAVTAIQLRFVPN
jgi:hypothetical protein